VREGLDVVGRELITGVREWIRWIAGQTERKSIEKLIWTGGREMSAVGGSTLIWRPSFLHRKTGSEDRKGEGLTLLTGDRIETHLHAAEAPREIERLRTKGTTDRMEVESGGSENENRNDSEVNGISIEGEFAFTKAVGEFLKEEVREGGYKGNYVLNVKDQLRMRTLREDEEKRKLRVVLLGSSQLNRIGNEMERKNKEKIEIVDRVRLEGVEIGVNMEKAKRVLEEHGDEVDVVLVAGPGNSLVIHGKEGERGFAGEREVRIVRRVNGEEDWSVRYHLTDPVKITMAEKAELVDKVVTFVEDIRDMTDDKVRVVVLTIPPRFVKPCCRDHMTDEDVWLLDGLRRDVNREIRDEVTERGLKVEVVEWWTLLGEGDDLTISDIRKRNFLDSDNVHLKKCANNLAAGMLCSRLLVREGTSGGGADSSGKRRRLI
jgi:hypothetical protein